MRMKEFAFLLADTLFQYSLLKQVSKRRLDASPTAPQTLGFSRHCLWCPRSHVSVPASLKARFLHMRYGLAAKEEPTCFATQSKRLRESGQDEEREAQRGAVEYGL